ncbi:MAG: hypothetical protein K2X53_05360 [Alphaproteobacteria bacterium]|nr:hypothetical protein [Alphaproteobacteria bacterium]
MKKLLSLILPFFLCYAYPGVSSETFEKAVQAEEFKVTPSQIDLATLNKASTLVVGCVDFRFVDELDQLMREVLHLKDDYDQINVPGASLFFVENGHPHWNKTLEEVVRLLTKLHHIKRVIFVDHMGCGAYKIIKGDSVMETPSTEEAAHREVFKEARAKMKDLFPELDVYTFLLDFSGHVKNVKS